MLQIATAGGLTVLLKPFDSLYSKGLLDDTLDLDAVGPFTPDMGDVAKREFFGDDFKRVHKYIWNPDQALKTIHNKEKHKVVIVGGGLGGLFSAYLLRDLKPVVLEQAPRFGGNAKGQTWKDIRYCMGSAYITVPPDDTPLKKIFQEIGLEKYYKFKKNHEPVSIDEKLIYDYWKTINDRLPQMDDIDELVDDFNKGRNGRTYPDISGDAKITKAVKKLDRLNFKEFLESALGEQIHPELLAQLDFYCAGAFNATTDEVSAAAALNFYCAEDGMVVLPGGNGLIAEQLLKHTQPVVGDKNLRANELVLKVEVTDKKANVYTINLDTEKITHIEADTAILACPKFVVGKILKNIEQGRQDAINTYKYRSYLVANVLLKKRIEPNFYEILMVKGNDLKNKMEGKNLRRATDVVHASFGMAGSEHTVLSMYRPMAYDGGRNELFQDGSYEKFRAEFETQIRSDVFPVLKISPSELVDIRITHWGHAVPIAVPGLLASEICQTVRAPFKNRVFFVEQDNWALPAMETSASEAIYWEPFIRKSLTT
jgi:protoporphyrinogen oxidase